MERPAPTAASAATPTTARQPFRNHLPGRHKGVLRVRPQRQPGKGDRQKGEETTYEYDALNRPTAVHLPDGISTYKSYNARDQVEELTTSCDDCGWILGHYLYTYDDRGYLIAEHTEEAREADPYGRQPHTPYKPERQGKNCDHGDLHLCET